MPEKRAYLSVVYGHRPKRFAKLMAVPEQEAREALRQADVRSRHLPVQEMKGYRQADGETRRREYRAFSRSFGHRLETLPEAQRRLLLSRCRDGLSWKSACRKTGYSESGALKIFRKTKDAP